MGTEPSKPDQILDLLLDLLEERQVARRAARASPPATMPPDPATVAVEPDLSPGPSPEGRGELEFGPSAPYLTEEGEEARSFPTPPPAPRGDVRHALGRLMALVGLLVLAANIPLTVSGLSLAHMAPSDRSVVIRDGLIVKGSGPEFYILQGGKLRWISSLDAFQHYGYRWSQVHQVDDDFLDEFERGAPLHVLLKCPQSAHIYRLENDRKRWIQDIATFAAEGHQWADVKMVDCGYLRGLPDGPPLPETAGPPPQP